MTDSALDNAPTDTSVSASRADAVRAVVGHHYRSESVYEVGAESIRQFARAVRAFHPAHWDEQAAADLGYEAIVAPPTMVAIMGGLAQRKLFEEVIAVYDLSQVLQTDQQLEFHRPVRAGDRLVFDVTFESFRQLAGSDLLVTRNDVYDERTGEAVMTTVTTLAARTDGESNAALLDAVEGVMMYGGL